MSKNATNRLAKAIVEKESNKLIVPFDEALKEITNKMPREIAGPVKITALSKLLLKIMEEDEMSVAQIASTDSHFIAVGVMDIKGNDSPAAEATRMVIDSLVAIKNGEKLQCACESCKAKRQNQAPQSEEVSFNAQVAAEILAEMEGEQQ